MSILFAGDVHGNTSHLLWLFKQAKESKANAIVVAGDFGYWPHYESGQEFIADTAAFSEDHNIDLYWVDGNHENHDKLNELVEEHGNQHPIRISGRVYYIPRGCIVNIDDRNIMGFGGAVSVDRGWRTAGETWWASEAITADEVDALKCPTSSNAQVDILVTHEAPAGPALSYKDDPDPDPVFMESVAQRDLVKRIQDKVMPTVHICGHHHTRATWRSGATTVHVLNRDTMRDSFIVI